MRRYDSITQGVFKKMIFRKRLNNFSFELGEVTCLCRFLLSMNLLLFVFMVLGCSGEGYIETSHDEIDDVHTVEDCELLMGFAIPVESKLVGYYNEYKNDKYVLMRIWIPEKMFGDFKDSAPVDIKNIKKHDLVLTDSERKSIVGDRNWWAPQSIESAVGGARNIGQWNKLSIVTSSSVLPDGGRDVYIKWTDAR